MGLLRVLLLVGFVVTYLWLILAALVVQSLPVWGGGAACRATPRVNGRAGNAPSTAATTPRPVPNPPHDGQPGPPPSVGRGGVGGGGNRLPSAIGAQRSRALISVG